MKKLIISFAIFWCAHMSADNQTPTVSPIAVDDSSLPFTVKITQADFQLLGGLHSFACAMYDGKWLILCGRTNGLHGFSNTPNNFPPVSQNYSVYVVDPEMEYVAARALTDPSSGLNEHEIDTLSVTSPQSYQKDKTLYITGGYGVESSTGNFSTKNTLTAIDIPGLMEWVRNPSSHHTAKDFIRQTTNDAFRVTGGFMTQIGDDHPSLLVFGQDFEGPYYGSSNGVYSEQVRRFEIYDDGKTLTVDVKDPQPLQPDPSFRRRDLNVVSVMQEIDGKTKPALIAFSGVFTETTGIWTVPVEISSDGDPVMKDPTACDAFKQGMNNYVSASLGIYSSKHGDMYTVLFGGISYGFFTNGQFETDSEFPFINEVTTIKRDRQGLYEQFLMDATYPTIVSTQANAGNELLFGAGAQFFPKNGDHQYANGVFKLGHLEKGCHHVGYIVGGIQSTVPNTTSISDTSASAYIFNVYVEIK